MSLYIVIGLYLLFVGAGVYFVSKEDK